MKIIIRAIFTFFTVSAFAQELYLTVKGDTIEKIIEKNLPVDLTDRERDKAKRMIRKHNPHIRDWYDLRPGRQIDLSRIDFNVKEVVYIRDNPKLYLDQAIYKIGLMWGLHSMTYLERISDFEVQSDSVSALTFGANFLYSYGKNKKYWRYSVGHEVSSFSFYDESITWFKLYKEKKRRNYFFFLEYNKSKQTFETLNESQFKITKTRNLHFLNIGYQLDYYFLGNDSYFYFEVGAMVAGSGNNVDGANAFVINMGNSYGVTKRWSVKPFMKFIGLDSDNDSYFLTLGIDLGYSFDVI